MASSKGFVLISVLMLAMIAGILVQTFWYVGLQSIVLWREDDTEQQLQLTAEQALETLSTHRVDDPGCLGFTEPINASTVNQFPWHPLAETGLSQSWHVRVFQDCFRSNGSLLYQRDAVMIQFNHQTQWRVS